MKAPVALVSQRVDDHADRRERRDALDQRWATLLEEMGLLAVAVPNTLVDPCAFATALAPAIIVLTGGNDLGDLDGATGSAPERDATEARLLEFAAAAAIPTLGVCRGMQMMVRHAGGVLTRVLDHVARPHPVEVVGGRWPLRNGRIVNSFHDWGVTAQDVGHDLVAVAFAPDGTVEAIEHRHLPHAGVMWHPERDADHHEDLELIRALVSAAVS